ncbi:torsin-1A-interacting protein 2 isoform X2 [Danio aesculapii]|uniref:torsin-1A-interacting protein 2 isoform X2 n=1 Tax=Danio aesculapii TaxID=1142201 RepID=UPI0024C082FF|nr:torsin-1A-interacting protein 2 isoform X2 [Danio aesculapii]
MDSGDSKEDGVKIRRRSTRQASKTGSNVADHRPRLKRRRDPLKDDGESTVVNGSKESKSLENGNNDESRNKRQKLKNDESTGDVNEKGDGFNNTDVEMDESDDQDQEMDEDEDAEQDNETKTHFHATSMREAVCPVQVWRENLQSGVVLERRRSIHENYVDYDKHKHSIPNRSITTSQERFPAVRQRSIREKTDQETHKRSKTVNIRSETTSQAPSVIRITRSRMTNQNPVAVNDALPFGNWNRSQLLTPPSTNQTAHHKTTEKKPVFSKPSPVSPTRGWMWSICRVLILLLILTGMLVSGYLIYHKFISAHLSQTDVVHSETLKNFAADLAGLQTVFPSQRSEFWNRSGKHLKGHLQTVKPTESVSVILTAGLRAEKTLGCLARRLATVFSAFHNASILEINGNSKSTLDSDQVKLEIDEALKKAFEGDKPAAVVHNFEELPPGSTLIFYRYCDHENAAYKNVFLVFTVKLSVDEIDPSVSLSQVEEMVLDHVKQKFITSEKSAKFNQMDVDKLSGLWSRISHLVLPVAAEENIEQEGCEV